MKSIKDVILTLNILKITNLRVIKFLETNKLFHFQNLNHNNISQILKLDFLLETEKSKIYSNFLKIDLEKIKHRMEIFSIKYLTILDDLYPERLRNIFNPPAIIFYKGNLSILENPMAIVGARKATNYGIWATRKIVSELSLYNLTIVSGMALGIDKVAHTTALDKGMKSIGVLASSLDIQYPRSNMDVYARMADQLLISESCLDVYPIRLNFVMRNRLISGISLAVLVAEAKKKSGSLITARYAYEQGRDVFAIPGQINAETSEGCNNLIKDGAKLVTCGKDIIEEFDFLKELNKIEGSKSILHVNKDELSIIKLLENSSMSINKLGYISGLSLDNLYKLLINLEMKGIVSRYANGEYSLKI